MSATVITEHRSQRFHAQRPAAAALWAEKPVDIKEFSAIHRRTVLHGCKWDAQVGDAATLASFPLVMTRSVWNRLAAQAEQLTAEADAAEQEIARRPELLGLLGLPTVLRRVLAANEPLTPAAGRVVRFDFHLTAEGWRISEANSDVPGGFTEASHFTGLMAEHYPRLKPAGNPAETWSDALAATAGAGGQVALLSAPGLLSDHQVIAFLASALRARGCQTHLAKPEQIRWREGIAHLDTSWHRGALDLVVRFYQAEWLPRLPRNIDWRCYFRGGKTPVSSPPLAVISESKRFPLAWKHLSTSLPTWRKLLPPVRDPRDTSLLHDQGWLLKTAFCNTGEVVCIRSLMKPHQWWHSKIWSRLQPNKWIAQRRFESAPVPTPLGPRHACVGVYTVNGKAAGAYARLAEKPLIDYTATDVALLIEENE